MDSNPSLHLRSYEPSDFSSIQNWVTDERTHALWSAGHMPSPLTATALAEKLMQGKAHWNDEAFVCADEHDQPIGFAVCSITTEKHRAHIKYVIVNPMLRGSGIGTRMIEMLLNLLFDTVIVHFVTLNVFDINTSAIRCYQKAGFRITSVMPDVFSFQNEQWGRISMQKDR